MLKDSMVFRDSVSSVLLPSDPGKAEKLTLVGLLSSGSSFSGALATLFAPMGAEYNLAAKFPQSEVTVNNIAQYQVLMEELRGQSAACSTMSAADSKQKHYRPSWS
jgi:amphiphysin